MSEITIFSLYVIAAAAFATSRLQNLQTKSRMLFVVATLSVACGITLHGEMLYERILVNGGFDLSLGNTVSLIAFELAVIGLIAAIESSLRGISAGLLLLAAVASTAMLIDSEVTTTSVLAWQVKVHVLISLMSYGLLTVGAIVSIYAMIQDKRLQAGNISSVSSLFAPLETTEKLLFGICAAGFTGLAVAIFSGLAFVDNLLTQHLAHKTVFSILALLVFGTLLAGRFFAGWRGTRAVKLYLWGFLLLCLAYFGVRLILEQLLQRNWG